MSNLNLELRNAENRLNVARINQEAPEVIHGLMLDVARVLEKIAVITLDKEAVAQVRRSAMTLIPMFGMDAEFQHHEMRRRIPWWRWRQRRDWCPPDYVARLMMYRERIY